MRILSGALAAALAAGAAGAQDAREAFADRAAAIALDDRCGFFTAPERAALEAAWLQSRGVLLREGRTRAELEEAGAHIVRRMAATPCDDPQALGRAAVVRGAYEGYRRLSSMEFPGDARSWRAERNLTADTWPLAQAIDDGGAVFGLAAAAAGVELSLLCTPPAGATPASAVIVARAAQRSPGLHDPSLGGLLADPERPGWVRWAPPEHAEALFWANRRQLNGRSARFAFPDAARDAIAALDPREAIRIDIFDGAGRRIARHYVEVGDFAAGLAFLAAGASPAREAPSLGGAGR